MVTAKCVQFRPSGNVGNSSSDAKRGLASASEQREAAFGWESFVVLCDRANFVRNFFWNQPISDVRVLLTHFLTRLRRFYSVDFCFGFLTVNERKLAEVGIPESSMGQLPKNFSRRCMNLVANSRAPITWNEVSSELSFHSTVVAPIAPAAGPSFGFLMLGNAARKTYSGAELFVLQQLAVELSWVVRDLILREDQERQLAAHTRRIQDEVKEILAASESIGGSSNSADAAGASGDDKRLERIQSSARRIQERVGFLAGGASADLDEPANTGELSEIASFVKQAIASCRHAAVERDVDIDVIYAPRFLGAAKINGAALGAILHVLVNEAARATRSEIVRLTVRDVAAGLELWIQGMESDRVAEKLKALFESKSHGEALDEKGEAFMQLREYLDKAGGDVYLRSRPGDPAELIICLPRESSAQAGRPRSESHLSAEELA